MACHIKALAWWPEFDPETVWWGPSPESSPLTSMHMLSTGMHADTQYTPDSLYPSNSDHLTTLEYRLQGRGRDKCWCLYFHDLLKSSFSRTHFYVPSIAQVNRNLPFIRKLLLILWATSNRAQSPFQDFSFSPHPAAPLHTESTKSFTQNITSL